MKMKDIPFPKEYGSWGILLTSCGIGIFMRDRITWQVIASLAGIAVLFMTKASLGIFIRRRNRTPLLFTLAYVCAGVVLLLPAIFNIGMKNTAVLSYIPAMTVAVYAVSVSLHRERAAIVEFFAMATLTMPVLFFCLEGSGRPVTGIVLLWASTFLYFSASIFRVKMLLFRKPMYRVANILYVLFVFAFISIIICAQFLPLLSAAAFAPLLENGADVFRHTRKRNLKAVGITELVKGTLFAVIIIIASRHVII
jgi:YwiC-like protein